MKRSGALHIVCRTIHDPHERCPGLFEAPRAGVPTSREEEAGPEPYRPDYDSLKDYLVAWHMWRAVKRDWDLPRICRDHQMMVDGREAMLVLKYGEYDAISHLIKVLGEPRYAVVMRTLTRMHQIAILERLREEGREPEKVRLLHQHLHG